MPSKPREEAAEFDMLMARAGLTLPDDLRAVLLPAYGGLCEQVAMLRSARTATAEPSNTFRLQPLADV